MPEPIVRGTVVALTGASACGKTTLAEAMARQFDLSCLHNDAIMAEVFNVLRHEETATLHRVIASPNRWQHLLDVVDLKELFRLYHRDHYLARGAPLNVLVVGWMYSLEDWRHALYDAFSRIPGKRFRFHLVHYNPADDVFVERFMQRTRALKGAAAVVPERRNSFRATALAKLNRYRQSVFEPLSADEPAEFTEVADARELEQLLASHLGLAQRVPDQGVADPVVYLDRVERGVVHGWALDRANPEHRLAVEVVCDGRRCAAGVAADYRADVAAAGFGDGWCGFALPLEAGAGSRRRRRFRVQLVDVEGEPAGNPVGYY